MKKVIITGSTGMVGRGVLLECLERSEISEVLVINRNSLEMNHPKLKEILLGDFLAVETIKDALKGYDACFYCMGVSAAGMSEERYTKITFDATRAFADTLFPLNPEMTFIYVSGTGTDSSESGRMMWARVKGRTENYILKKGFKDAYAFRPGIIIPEKGIKSKTKLYNSLYTVMRPFFPLLKKSKGVTTTTKVGLAMLNVLEKSNEKKQVDNREINRMAGD